MFENRISKHTTPKIIQHILDGKKELKSDKNYQIKPLTFTQKNP